jgi:signal peptidase I
VTPLALAAAAVPLVACAAGILLARRRFVVVTVAGASMEPALRPGDRVLVRRSRRGPFRVGAIVVFAEPEGRWPGDPPPGTAGPRWVIKRIAAVPGGAVPDSVRPVVSGAGTVPPGMLVVLGDGARSGDSRQWGFIPADQALGQAVRKLAGAGGAGPVRPG